MEKVQEFTVHIAKEQEGEYLPYPIEIDDQVEKLTVEYTYTRQLGEIKDGHTYVTPHAIIDFSMIGPDEQFLGSSGSNRSTLYFSRTNSSVGFSNPSRMNGTWHILIGAYEVPEAGIDVVYTLRTEEKQRHLLKGDLHAHTTGSDGQLSLDTLVQVAREMQLDYLFITDHNNYHQSLARFNTADFVVLPGVEWTQYKGHGNFLGVDAPLDSSFVAADEEAVRDRIRREQDRDALFVVNHPFCPNVPWKWSLDVPFDAVELFNGGTNPLANMQALDWWHEQLLKGRQIPVVGGSDFHRFSFLSTLASPTTNLYAKSRSQEDILTAIRQGSAYITHQIDAPVVDIYTDAGHFIGETISPDETITIELKGLNHNSLIVVVTDKNEAIYEIAAGQVDFTKDFSAADIKFLRVEVWSKQLPEDFHKFGVGWNLISNPIYVGE